MDAFEILVLILSIMLAIVLLIGIIAGVFFVKIIKDIRHITEKAANAADNIEHAAELFKNTSSVAAITKMIGNAVGFFNKSNKKKNGADNE